MPSLRCDSQSFIWNDHRLWFIGANVEYATLAPQRWSVALRALKQMGFNTIRTSAPWCLHEPRAGRMDFTGALNVAAFVELCREIGLHVILRIGPVVGEPFDGGGLPAWLADDTDVKSRVANAAFLKYVSQFFQAIGKQIAPLQATIEANRNMGFAGGKANDGGALCAIQIENAWTCGNETEGHMYHAELLRYARESGFTVPVLTNNGLWISVEGCIEIWEGWNDLFCNLRQLRAVQPNAPRLVEIREEAAREAAHATQDANQSDTKSATSRGVASKRVNGWSDGMEYLRRMGQILCAGGQPTLPGVARTDRTNAVPAMLNAVGQPDNDTRQVRRMVSFANSFGFIFASANGANQAAVQDLDSLEPGSFAIVTVEGGGTIVFVFRGADLPSQPRRDATTIITPNGVRLAVQLGDAPVGWYLSGINLHGAGTLDYCNLSPFAFIQKKMLVLQGAAGTQGVLCIDGAEIEFTLPKLGENPLVFSHLKFTIVVCNQEQIDATLCAENGVTIGADEVQAMQARLSPGFSKAIHISLTGTITQLRAESTRKQSQVALNNWQVAECTDYVLGTSERFATLAAAQSLAKCGVAAGWGWYRLTWKADSKKSAAQLVHFPQASGLMHTWINGKSIGVLGKKSTPLPLSVKSKLSDAKPKGKVAVTNTITLLARQGGRTASDAGHHRAAGITGHALAVTQLKTKLKVVASPIIQTFQAKSFLANVAHGHHMSTHAAQISFAQAGQSVITLDAPNTSLRAWVVLNGSVIDFIDWKGGLGDALVLRLAPKGAKTGLKNGNNEVTLVPTSDDDDKNAMRNVQKIMKHIRLFHSPQENISSNATWSFARWQAPASGHDAWKPLKSNKPGVPRWFRAQLNKPECDGQPITIHCDGLSCGHVLINGKIAGDFNSQEGRMRIDLPTEDMPAVNTLDIFDVQGQSPSAVKVSVTR